MPNPFAAADALSSAAVSFVYGERLKLIPWLPAGNWTEGGHDARRPIVEFSGVLSGSVSSQNLRGDEGGSDFSGSATTRDRKISVDARVWPAGAKAGDRVQALDQPGEPMHEITSVVPDTMNRVSANMVKL